MITFERPDVTVLMPVYNGEPFLSEAIDSILGQSLQDLELLVIDDGSTDRSGEIIESYAARDSRVRLLRNPCNQGLIRTLNQGITECRGRYIARMDADDRCHPQRLKRQRDYLDAHPEVAVLGTQYRLIDERNRVLPQSARLPVDPVAVRWRMFFGCAVAHGTIMIRPETYRLLGSYDESFVASEDYELWLRGDGRIKIANLNMVLYDVRSHGTSVTRTQWQLTGANSERAVTMALSKQLGCVVDPLVVRILLAPEHVVARGHPHEAVLASVGTIHELAGSLLSLAEVSSRELRFVERDAAWTLARMLAACIRKRPRGAWRILRRSPLLPTQLAVRLLVAGAGRRLGWEIIRRRWAARVARGPV